MLRRTQVQRPVGAASEEAQHPGHEHRFRGSVVIGSVDPGAPHHYLFHPFQRRRRGYAVGLLNGMQVCQPLLIGDHAMVCYSRLCQLQAGKFIVLREGKEKTLDVVPLPIGD